MENSCTAFFKRHDQLGSLISLTHSGSAQYGTFLGGCISIIVTTFFFLFISIQLIAWQFYPAYDIITESGYLSTADPESFKVSMPEFMPYFKVITEDKDGFDRDLNARM